MTAKGWANSSLYPWLAMAPGSVYSSAPLTNLIIVYINAVGLSEVSALREKG